jgi:anaerobic magnesium-protoporphyrin IX monomethyl ester cyclase
MLDVLLVTPSSRTQVYQSLSNEFAAIEPPVMSGLIATYVRRAGFEVAMLDAEAEGLTHEQTAARIVALSPRLAVFMICGQQPSASTQCMPTGRKACEALNEMTSGEIPTLVVGTHPSALPERTLREEPYTYVCQGEGPATVAILAGALKNGSDLRCVPGLWYRDADCAIRHNTPARLLGNLDDELPGQAWDLLDMSLYRSHNWHSFDNLANRARYASLQTSLGCPFKCSFCCINAPFGVNTVRHWSPESVIGQIDVLVERYGVRNIKIHDEMFVLNPKQVMGIADKIIERGYDLNFWAYARIDTLQNEAMIAKLKRAGFNWMAIGVESGSKFVRDGVTKGRFNNDNILTVIDRVRDHGINVLANYIFGLPDDTLASMRETLDMALALNTPWANFYSAMAYPGSQLYQLARSKGWRLPDDPDGPGWIGYSQHAYECLPLPTETLAATQVLDFRDAAFEEYFRNAFYLDGVRQQFGQPVVDHIRRMLEYKLPRRHREMATAT